MAILHLRARLTFLLLLGACAGSQAQPWSEELLTTRPLRPRHVRELRDAIDAKRGPSGCNRPASRPWQANIAPGARVGVLWINELRQAIRDLSSDLGESTQPSFTEPDPIVGGAGVRIRPIFITELRGHVERLRARPCPAPTCVCDAAWSDDACGASGCAAGEMHQTRSCAPGGCLPQSRCEPASACVVACTYGAWQDSGACGSRGCARDEKPQIQTGVPAMSCPARFQCAGATDCRVPCQDIPPPPSGCASPRCCEDRYWVCGEQQCN